MIEIPAGAILIGAIGLGAFVIAYAMPSARSTANDLPERITPTLNDDVNADLITKALAVLSQVQFLNYQFIVREAHGGVVLYAEYDDPDIYTGAVEKQTTRKWLLSPHATASEIVQTAFKCCITSMEHKTRESFKLDGRRIFGPHFDVLDLWTLCADRESAGGRG